ncbi:MAG: hypothetical protein OEY81_01810 [Candidatus Bathyarchaeota archaeon]|nr:hypothetical protein [Candidatus Bathyarchaeota archaeon]
MKYDYHFFLRRYEQIENEFLEISDFIELQNDFDHPSYSVGSSKMMDFCLKVGTEVETLFREILNGRRFDSVSNIDEKRENQNIDVYREVIEPVYQLKEYILLVNFIDKEIQPFEKFDLRGNPEWFGIYSKYKHNKIRLIEKWNLKHSLFSLGCLLILVINHPSIDGKVFGSHKVSQRVFDLLSSAPKFGAGIISVRY